VPLLVLPPALVPPVAVMPPALVPPVAVLPPVDLPPVVEVPPVAEVPPVVWPACPVELVLLPPWDPPVVEVPPRALVPPVRPPVAEVPPVVLPPGLESPPLLVLAVVPALLLVPLEPAPPALALLLLELLEPPLAVELAPPLPVLPPWPEDPALAPPEPAVPPVSSEHAAAAAIKTASDSPARRRPSPVRLAGQWVFASWGRVFALPAMRNLAFDREMGVGQSTPVRDRPSGVVRKKPELSCEPDGFVLLTDAQIQLAVRRVEISSSGETRWLAVAQGMALEHRTV
jgi:hypothetical protein